MAAAAVEAAAAEAREILKPTKYHGKSFQSLIVFHEILKTAPRRSHAIHFRYGTEQKWFLLCSRRLNYAVCSSTNLPYYIRSDFKVGFFFQQVYEKI